MYNTYIHTYAYACVYSYIHTCMSKMDCKSMQWMSSDESGASFVEICYMYVCVCVCVCEYIYIYISLYRMYVQFVSFSIGE